MRISMFMPDLGPNALGREVHLDFAKAIEELGHHFELLSTGSSDHCSELVGTGKILDVPAGWQRLGRLASPLFRTKSLLPSVAALAKHLKQFGNSIDLLHVEVAYPHGAAAALAAKVADWKGPLVITPMGEDTLVVKDAYYGFRRYPVPRVLVDWTLSRAAGLRCISPMHEEWIAGLAPQVRRRVIPLNISLTVAAAAEESTTRKENRRRIARELVSSDFNISHRPIILSLGRLHPFKGLDVLIKAMASIERAVLLIAGPSLEGKAFGNEATRLLEIANKYGVDDRVQLLGSVSSLRSLELLAAADVVVVPSHLESLNKVCVEAAAVGTPFIVTKTTGICAWVPDSGVGIVVPPRDPGELVSAITDVLSGHWRLDYLSATKFVGRFYPQKVAAEVVDFYQTVLG